MKLYKTIALLLLGLSLSVSAIQETINIKLSDIDENGNFTVKFKLEQPKPVEPEQPPEEPPTEPEQPKPPVIEPTEFLFPEDWAEEQAQSTPSNIVLPKGISNLFDVEYLGAFRVYGAGDSNSNFANGALGFNPDNNSLYMAGKSVDGAIAEFTIPSELGISTAIRDLPSGPAIQNYSKAVLTSNNQDNDMRVTGMLWHEGSLLVTSNVWYDAGKGNERDIQVFDANNISAGSGGYLSVQGGAKAAGYMSKIPSNLTGKFNATHFMGWATNYSITSRYSQGPSLYTFNPNQAIAAGSLVETKAKVVYPHGQGKDLVVREEYYDEISQPRHPMWSNSKAIYSFFIPNSPYLLIAGQSTGIHRGIGYKIIQEGKTKPCKGGCPFDPTDGYNYFWIYHADDILSANEPHEPKPISYGKWSHPYDESGTRSVVGGAFDDTKNILYLTISEAGKVNDFSYHPLIIAYQINLKENN